MPRKRHVPLVVLLRPDGGAVLEHLGAHARDASERLDAGDVEDDLVAGLELRGLQAPPLLEADHVEPPLDVDAEVLQRSGEDPGGHDPENISAWAVLLAGRGRLPATIARIRDAGDDRAA